jgi:DNA-binding MarR family transcriptional regulator
MMDNQKDCTTIDAIARTCIALRLRLLTRVVTKLYDDALRPLDLKASQLDLLVVTAKLGLAQPAKICGLLQLDTSTLSRNVGRLRAKGWVELVPGADARTQPFRLTVRGGNLLQRALPAWEQTQRRATEVLGDAGIALVNGAANNLGLPRADQ